MILKCNKCHKIMVQMESPLLKRISICNECVIIMAFDPGKSTGVAMYPNKSFTLNFIELIDVVNKYQPDLIVYEDFIDFSSSHSRRRKGNYKVPTAKSRRHPIGVIEYLMVYAEKNRLSITKQLPRRRQALKYFNIDTMTDFKPETRHEEDAINHLFVFLYTIKFPNLPVTLFDLTG